MKTDKAGGLSTWDKEMVVHIEPDLALLVSPFERGFLYRAALRALLGEEGFHKLVDDLLNELG